MSSTSNSTCRRSVASPILKGCRATVGAGRLIFTSAYPRSHSVISELRESTSASLGDAQQTLDKTVQRTLVLYSKQGCCLCDGLTEKLQQVAALKSDGPLSSIHLEVRDITTNPEWEQAYQYEIPVLARIKDDNTEEVLPRLSPRMGVEQISKKLAAAFS